MNLQFIRALKSKSVVHTLFWRTGTYIYRLRRQHPQSPNTTEGISMVGTTEGKDLHRGWVIQRDLPTIRSVLAGLQPGQAVNLRPVREGQKWGGFDSFGRQARWIRGEANWWVIQEPREALEGVDDRDEQK